ncbi:PepSY domain-containing protein [Piscinibacter gummiphilus]|uniref:PepSY domain-containing protein n=1 Tax=Piscinibacter gummiphilus TaxID=946333 RepID=A0ABZ0D6I6_9BURK|nr:PepSY domain-containing protein [Piscinibacter gummiphilus]WOB10648.1 PepSY domain-containing protein [Piscinibacter gummiphilus]
MNTRRAPLLRLLGAIVALVGALLPGAPALAGGDHDRARAAVQAGEVLPLKTVLERVARSHPGEVLEVELEQEDGRWVYEIRLLQPGGRLVKLEVDAATAEVLRSKRRTH